MLIYSNSFTHSPEEKFHILKRHWERVRARQFSAVTIRDIKSGLHNALLGEVDEMEESLREELASVKAELADISAQIEALLERQKFCLSKKLQIETTLAADQNANGPTNDETNWSNTKFPWSEKLTKAREEVFKLTRFRPLQLECINVTMSGRDCILIMPTGGGKSLCFQLPAVISKGITLVVSPLVSLIEDQLMALRELGIQSDKLNASSSRQHVNSVHGAMVDRKSHLKLLYVTPEKISKSKRFMAKLEKCFQGKRVGCIV